MSTIPSFTMTTESISGVYKGQPFTVQSTSPHFTGLKSALERKAWDEVPGYLTIKKAVASWSQGEFTLQGESVRFQGESVPQAFSKRLLAMIRRGEDCKPLCRFFERLARNPSKRSVDQLFSFLQHCGIPITEDGCFLAYKGVRDNLKDKYSGKWDNAPGAINRMPRNHISDDPRHACHEGFHVGALSYAEGFGPRVVVCKVDPEHVVSVPYDESERKMRVCEYEVIGHHGQRLPSTTIPARDVPQPSKRQVTESTRSGDPGKTTKVKKAKGDGQTRGQVTPPTSTERKRFYRFDRKDADALLKQDLHHLRRYATCHLKLVGASKIRGGKLALVATICKVRDGE